MRLYCHDFDDLGCCGSCHEDDDNGLGYMCDRESPGRRKIEAYVCCAMTIAMDNHKSLRKLWADAIRKRRST